MLRLRIGPDVSLVFKSFDFNSLAAITIEELLTYHVHCLESINLVLDQQSVESGKLAQAFMIIDLTGLGMDVVNLLP